MDSLHWAYWVMRKWSRCTQSTACHQGWLIDDEIDNDMTMTDIKEGDGTFLFSNQNDNLIY